eukprot:s3180_g12.t1
MASPDADREPEPTGELAPAGAENRSEGVEGNADSGTPAAAQQETPEVSSADAASRSDAAPTLPPIAATPPVGAVAEAAAPAEAEEVQRAEIHFGEAQPEPVPTSRPLGKGCQRGQ